MPAMRILVWHGWLLEGTGSNVYAAKVAEVWRRRGHQVFLLCQDPHPERLPFVDEIGTVGADAPTTVPTGVPPADGRVILLRPEIGELLPVFVLDRYEGFRVRRFVDLSEDELDGYLEANAIALRTVDAWRGADVAVAGHLIPGPVVARRGLGDGRYVAKVHGSDLEYAVRLQERYGVLAREGVDGAVRVVGASDDVLARTCAVAPSAEGRTSVVAPGVDVQRWRPRARDEALGDAATRLAKDERTRTGRPTEIGREVVRAVGARDGAALDDLATRYDQGSPDRDASERIAALAADDRPIAGYLGKLIPEKGVERVIEAVALVGEGVRTALVGFGTFREWIEALVAALDAGDVDAYAWLREASPMRLELSDEEVRRAAGLRDRVTFTGRLDHRYAPEVVAALDVLVVPSTLEEAFGMVAAEAAAAGAIPLVARHSSLAEVAEALEAATGRTSPLSFEPGDGATRRLAEALERILRLPEEERRELARAARQHVAREWTWDRTADRLLAAAGG